MESIFGIKYSIILRKHSQWTRIWWSSKEKKTSWVWAGNHKVIAWQCHIDQYHGNEIDWHFNVDFICLDQINVTSVCLDATNGINMLEFNSYGIYLHVFACCVSCLIYLLACLKYKSMENNHVKTNLVHKIHWIQIFIVLKLHKSKTLLTHDVLSVQGALSTLLPWMYFYIWDFFSFHSFLTLTYIYILGCSSVSFREGISWI